MMRQITVATLLSPYNAPMLPSLLAALACVIAPPSVRVLDSSSVAIGGAMSLPLEAGPASSPVLVGTTLGTMPDTMPHRVSRAMPPATTQTTPQTISPIMPESMIDWTPASDALAPRDDGHAATLQLFTPLVVECASPGPDCGTHPGDTWRELFTRLDEGVGSCVLLPTRGRIAILARGHGRSGARHVAVGTIASRPDLLVPDTHASPLLWPARLELALALTTASVTLPHQASPPPAPARRIDRPPRA
jgi:hypothetical protein